MKILFLWEKIGKKPAKNEDKNEFVAFPVVRFSTCERSEKLGVQSEWKGKIYPSTVLQFTKEGGGDKSTSCYFVSSWASDQEIIYFNKASRCSELVKNHGFAMIFLRTRLENLLFCASKRMAIKYVG